MAAPSLTYTLTNGTTADASQVMQNYNDLLNGITDGTKDLSIAALTCSGNVTLNGNLAVGNATSDTLTVTARVASHLVPSADTTYDLGSSTLGWAGLYLGDGDAETARIVAAAHAASATYTIPDCATNATFVMSQLAQSISGLKTFNDGLELDDDANQSTLNYYRETSYSSTFSFNGSGGASSTGSILIRIRRIGKIVTLEIPTSVRGTSRTSSTELGSDTAMDSEFRPSSEVRFFCTMDNSGTAQADPGVVIISTTGGIAFRRDALATAWSNGAANCGMGNAHAFTWTQS